jgi:hypothetical protein
MLDSPTAQPTLSLVELFLLEQSTGQEVDCLNPCTGVVVATPGVGLATTGADCGAAGVAIDCARR